MRIVISRSAKPDKKLTHELMVEDQYTLDKKAQVILHNIKIYSARRGTYNGILKMKTGIIH